MKKDKILLLLLLPIMILSCSNDDEMSVAEPSEDFQYRLDSIIPNRDFFNPITYTYNTNGMLEFIGSNDPFAPRFAFEYGTDNTLVKQEISHYPDYYDIFLEYDRDEISTATVEVFYELTTTFSNYNFDLSNPSQYTVENVFGDSGTAGETVRHSVALDRDNQDRIVSYKKVNLSSKEEDVLEFTYSNGNLIEIHEVSNNTLWTIAYDEHTNLYRTLPFYKTATNIPFGDFYLDAYLQEQFLFIPAFTLFNNKNNPIRFTKNGETVTSRSYEYNEIGLISRYNFGDDYVDFFYSLLEP